MSQKVSIIIFLTLLFGFALTACGGDSEEPPNENEQTGDTAVPEEPSDTGGETTEVTLFVGPELVECTGLAPQTCMQVKESADAEYTFFYDTIEGFNYEEGYTYQLRVQVTPIENPPADGSSLQYALIEEVSKTPSPSGGEGISTRTGRPAADLSSVIWRLESYQNSDGAVVPVLDGVDVTLEFNPEGQLGGSTGCNSYNASYEVDGNNLSIGLPLSTMMACTGPEGVMAQEQAYLALLPTAVAYTVEDGKLILQNGEGAAILVYQAQTGPDLTETTWTATAVNNGQDAVVSLIEGTQITAIFSPDGSLTGSAGCNTYSASYTTEGGTISVTLPVATRMACSEPQGVMEQESHYLTALEAVAAYRINGETLELHSADGALLATFNAQSAAVQSPELMGDLGNMTYTIEGSAYTLSDGEVRRPMEDMPDAERHIWLLDHSVAGALTGGQEATVATLAMHTGGAGAFISLAVVVEQNGQMENVATTHLGDRVVINSLEIVDGRIVVDMINHGPDDPMCCPSQHTIQTYELQDSTLKMTATRVLE